MTLYARIAHYGMVADPEHSRGPQFRRARSRRSRGEGLQPEYFIMGMIGLGILACAGAGYFVIEKQSPLISLYILGGSILVSTISLVAYGYSGPRRR